MAERQDVELDKVAEASVILPPTPDRVFLDKKCQEIVEERNWSKTIFSPEYPNTDSDDFN